MTGKSRGGRPAVGPRISLRIPTDLVDRIDRHAEATGTTRSEILRRGAEELLARAARAQVYTFAAHQASQLKAIRDALLDEGRNPGDHLRQLRRLRDEWPALYRAVAPLLTDQQRARLRRTSPDADSPVA